MKEEFEDTKVAIIIRISTVNTNGMTSVNDEK